MRTIPTLASVFTASRTTGRLTSKRSHSASSDGHGVARLERTLEDGAHQLVGQLGPPTAGHAPRAPNRAPSQVGARSAAVERRSPTGVIGGRTTTAGRSAQRPEPAWLCHHLLHLIEVKGGVGGEHLHAAIGDDDGVLASDVGPRLGCTHIIGSMEKTIPASRGALV